MGRCMEVIMVLVQNKEIAVYVHDIEEYVTFDDMARNGVALTRDEAIAAARAILKHFNCGMEE